MYEFHVDAKDDGYTDPALHVSMQVYLPGDDTNFPEIVWGTTFVTDAEKTTDAKARLKDLLVECIEHL
jgi:hypothetical protein